VPLLYASTVQLCTHIGSSIPVTPIYDTNFLSNCIQKVSFWCWFALLVNLCQALLVFSNRRQRCPHTVVGQCRTHYEGGALPASPWACARAPMQIYPDAGVAAMVSYQWQDRTFNIDSLVSRRPVQAEDDLIVIACPGDFREVLFKRAHDGGLHGKQVAGVDGSMKEATLTAKDAGVKRVSNASLACGSRPQSYMWQGGWKGSSSCANGSDASCVACKGGVGQACRHSRAQPAQPVNW